MDVPDQELSEFPGVQLSALRLSQSVSQRHLSELSGVDQATISRLERGASARWPTWRALFVALGWNVVLRPYLGQDDVEDFLKHGVEERQERAAKGREARWG